MVQRHERGFFFIRPDQVGDVAHRHGENQPRGAEPDRGGHAGSQENVAVAGGDGAGHGGDEHIEPCGHDPFVRGGGRG